MGFQPGDVIAGKYRITRRIGDGGMGEVFAAQHLSLQTDVALKFLHAELAKIPGFSARFMQEARISARIRHQHAIQVFDVDRLPGGAPYLVMELLAGESLQSLMDRHPGGLKPDQVIDFALQILAGLEAAHALGIVHRDLKPDNVYIVPGAGGPVLKILDFGIAKLRDSSEYRSAEKKQELTRPGAVMGTPEYMAPEQAFSASAASERSDLYSLGVILYEMLSGKLPAQGEMVGEIAAQVLRGDVQRVTELCRIPDALGSLVHHLMSPSPDDRPESATKVRQALAAFATQLSPAGSIAAAGHRASQLPVETTAGGTQKIFTVSTRVDESKAAPAAVQTGPAASVSPTIEKTLPPDEGPPPVTGLPPEPQRTVQAKAMEPPEKPTTTADMEAPPATAVPPAPAPTAQPGTNQPGTNQPAMNQPPGNQASPAPGGGKGWLVALVIVLLLGSGAGAAAWYYQDYWWNTSDPPPLPQPQLQTDTASTSRLPSGGMTDPPPPTRSTPPRTPATRPPATTGGTQPTSKTDPATPTPPASSAASAPAPSATTPEMIPGVPFGVQLPPLPSTLPSVLPSNLPLPFPTPAPAPTP